MHPLRQIVRVLALMIAVTPLQWIYAQTFGISGEVIDQSGAAVVGASVSVAKQGTANGDISLLGTMSTRTGPDGRFSFQGLSAGSYTVEVLVSGFASSRLTVEVGADEGANVTITVPLGIEGPKNESPPIVSKPVIVEDTPSGGGGDEEAAHQFDSLIWNVWQESYSSKPSFKPVDKLMVGRPYELVLDLSALEYEAETGAFSRSASPGLDGWTRSELGSESTLEILVVPDERFFQAQRETERVKQLDVNLDKLRSTRQEGFKLTGSAFEYLRGHANAPFSFARQSFRIETKAVPGTAAIAIMIWADGRPIDEISVPVCVVKKTTDPCDRAAFPHLDLNGVDGTSRGSSPDAALHLVELDSSTVIGVFRCNSCPDWHPGEYRTWTLGRSAAWLSEYLTTTILPQFENASKQNDEAAFQTAGLALYHAIFQNNSGTAGPSSAEQGFTKFVAQSVKRESSRRRPASIFIRLLPHNPDHLFMFPLAMMLVPLPSGPNVFVGFHFRVQTPLELQDYTSPSACISKWVLLVPPPVTSANVDDSPNPLADARTEFEDWINAFDGWAGHAQVLDDLDKFGGWLSETTTDPNGTAIFIMSHHDKNKLFFNSETDVPAILSANVTRFFSSPSIAIINACGTADPAAFDFVQALNRVGVYSIIATSTPVDGAMTGLFASTLLDLIRQHAADPTYTLEVAKFDAVNAVSKLPENRPYGSQALVFSLIGNGNIQLCVPTTGTETHALQSSE